MVNTVRILCSLLAAALLVLVCVGAADAYSGKNCDRGSFGSYQVKDYKDTRARILESHALDRAALKYRKADSGRVYVDHGSWTDVFTGRDLIDVSADKVQIDHVVPLCWAWYHGAAAWSYDKRKAFNNDTRFLLVVASGLNAAKGDSGPDVFMPLNRAFACDYVLLFLEGVAAYGLVLTADEKAGIDDVRSAACSVDRSLFN